MRQGAAAEARCLEHLPLTGLQKSLSRGGICLFPWQKPSAEAGLLRRTQVVCPVMQSWAWPMLGEPRLLDNTWDPHTCNGHLVTPGENRGLPHLSGTSDTGSFTFQHGPCIQWQNLDGNEGYLIAYR